jgi:DegV family protein with EDD domain
MNSIHIVTDSTCDIPPDLAERWNIQIVPCYVNFGTQSFLDGVNLSREEFYRRLATQAEQPTTAAPPPGIFADAYRLALPGASGVISLHPPDHLSALRQVAANGWELTGSTLPYRALDAGQISMGLGWITIELARAAAAGADMHSLENLLAQLRRRVHLEAALSTVEYLRRSGRVGWARGAIGRLLRVRPILHIYQGEIQNAGFTRTQSSANQRLRDDLNNLGQLEGLVLLHTDAAELVGQLQTMLEPLNLPEPTLHINATPILGSHVGPGALGFVAIQAAS